MRSSTRAAGQQLDAGADRGDRVAQVVAEHGDELFAQRAHRLGVQQGGAAGVQPLLDLELRRDQLGEEGEGGQHLAVAQPGGLRVERADGAEDRAVAADDGHRDVAFEAVAASGIGWVA